MIRLILARHGNTFEPHQSPTQVGARTDLPLTAQGRKQAEELGKALQSMHPTAIYAGALKRQIESAEIMNRLLNSQLHLEPALTEIDYGAWEGLTSEEITHRWGPEYASWTDSAQWAEGIFGGTLQQHLAHIESWLASLRKAYRPGDTIVAVSSNGLIRFFHHQWQSLAATKQMEMLKVKTGHFCELQLYPVSLVAKTWNAKPM